MYLGAAAPLLRFVSNFVVSVGDGLSTLSVLL